MGSNHCKNITISVAWSHKGVLPSHVTAHLHIIDLVSHDICDNLQSQMGAGSCLPLILQLVSLPSITLLCIFVDSGTQAPSNQCPLSLPLGPLHPARKDLESGASSGPSGQGRKWRQSLPLLLHWPKPVHGPAQMQGAWEHDPPVPEKRRRQMLTSYRSLSHVATQ